MMTNLQSSAFVARTTQLLSSVARLRLLLVMLLTLTVSANAWGADVVYKTAKFGSSYNSAKVSSYTSSWYSTYNGFRVDIVNANNNQNGWSYIKMGSKTAASTGTITTNAKIDAAITQVSLKIDAITVNNITSITLKTATSSNGTYTSVGTFTKATGTQTVTLASPTANLFYKIEVVCTKGSSNGLIQISQVDYYKSDVVATPEYNITNVCDKHITYTSTKPETIQVDDQGFELEFSVNDGYQLNDVQVKMGGQDLVLDEDYLWEEGYLLILPETDITGDIEITFVTVSTCTTNPTVSAGSHSNVTTTTATVSCSGGITSLGSAGCSIESYGFVYGTSSNPTISNTKVQVGTTYTTTGTAFSKELTGLTANTTYYVRPYATNGNGTAYGTQTSFKTLELPKYTVTLNAGSGTCAASVTETSAGAGVTLPTPTLDCGEWSFAGWAEASVGTETTTKPTLIAAGTYKPASNITLYAVYQRTEETEGNGGTENVSRSYTFSNFTAGTQYAEGEEHELDDVLTLTTTQCHFTSELRIYSSDTHNGYVVSNQLPGRIISIGFNAGNKVDAIDVFGSTNGTDWTKVGQVDVTSTSYKDYTLSFGETDYTYFKLDVAGSNQVRLKSMTITWESTTAGGPTTTTYYHSVPDCTTETAVTLNPNGGEINDNGNPQTIQTENGTLTLPEPTRDCYTFTNWTTNEDGTGESFDAGEIADWDSENTTLYAQWTQNTYTITWKNGDAVLETDNNVPCGTTPTYDSATPTKPSTAQYTYSFNGWNPEIYAADKDQVYTAQFASTTRQYTVTFDANGHGSAPANQTVDYGTQVTEPSAPTATGYTFGGWYKESGCTNAWNFATDVVTGNITLYAKWTAKALTNYRTDCDACNLLTGFASISGTYHFFPGETITMTVTPPEDVVPYTYQWQKLVVSEWDDLEGATTTTYTKTEATIEDVGHYRCVVSAEGYCDAIAEYNVKCLQLNVYYDDHTLAFTTPLEKVDATTAIKSVNLENANYKYYFEITDGCENFYGFNGDIHSGWYENVELNAMNSSTHCGLQTTKFGTYLFTVDHSYLTDDNKSYPVVTVTYPSGLQEANKVIYLDNHVLDWTNSDNAEGKNKIYYRIGSKDYNSKTAMTLVPGTANLYKVTTSEYNNFEVWHIANNGCWSEDNPIYKTNTEDDWAATQATAFETLPVTLESVTVTPTTSIGNGGEDRNSNCEFFNYDITEGMKTWNAEVIEPTNGTITVEYTHHDGTEVNDFTSGTRDLAHTCLLTITATADEGYSLASLTVNDVPFTSGNTHTLTEDAVIKAEFTINTHTVTWKPAGGNWSGDANDIVQTYEYNELIEAPEKPVRTGYEFVEWTPAYASNMTMPDEDLEFTAQWQINQYTVTLNPNYPNGKTGTFTYDAGELVDGNLVLTYDYNIASMTIEDLYTSLTLDGYDFGGWYNAKGVIPGEVSGFKCTTTGDITGNKTYYAKWTKVYSVILSENGTTNELTPQTSTSYTLPEILTAGSCENDEKALVGWSTVAIPNPGDKPTSNFYELGETVTLTEDQTTFYAVFATVAGGGVENVDATLSFATTDQRTEYSTSKQVWSNEGITLTNDKASSTSNVGNYSDPARFYKSSDITITTPGNITQIVFTCNTEAYATSLATSIGDSDLASGTIVTLILNGTSDSYEVTLSDGQVRMKSLTVTYTTGNGTSYSDYSTVCEAIPDPVWGGAVINRNSIKVDCGSMTKLNAADPNGPATISFPAATNHTLTYDITVTASEGFLVSTNKTDATKYGASVTVSPNKTGDNAGKITQNVYVVAVAPAMSDEDFTGTITLSGKQLAENQVIDVTADVTCTTYTLTLNDRGTKTTAEYYAGASVPKPADPEGVCTDPINYVFDGWSLDPVTDENTTSYEKVTFPFDMPAGKTTLYAVYRWSEAGGGDGDYHLVEKALDDWSGDYLIAYSNTIFANGRIGGKDEGIGALGVQVDLSSNILGNAIPASVGDEYNVTLEAITGGYLMKTKDGQYNYQSSNESGLSSTENKNVASKYPIVVDFVSSSDVKLCITSAETGSLVGPVFHYNTTSSGYFRFYKDGGQKAVYLYKKSSGTNYFTTSPVCGPHLVITEGKEIYVTGGNAQAARDLVMAQQKVSYKATRLNTKDGSAGGTAPDVVVANNGITKNGIVTSEVKVTFENTIKEQQADGTYTITGDIVVTYEAEANNLKEDIQVQLAVDYPANADARDNFIVHARSLPSEFVIVAKSGDKWYALNADMSSSKAQPANGQVTLNDPDNPTEATYAPCNAIYTFEAMPQGAEDRKSVRFIGMENKYLWAASEGNNGVQNYSKNPAADALAYNWKLYTEDNITYHFGNAQNTRMLGLHSTNVAFGMYANGASVVQDIRILPYVEKCIYNYAPTNLTVTDLKGTHVTLTWDAVVGATKYQYSDDATNWTDCGTEPTVTITGLIGGTTYTYYIRAYHEDAGVSNECIDFEEITFTTADCDDVPTNISYSADLSTITVTWMASSATSTVKLYSDKEGTTVLQTIEGTNSVTFEGLIKNTQYYVQVFGGGSCASAIIPAKTKDVEMDVVEWMEQGIIVDVNTNEKIGVTLENEVAFGTGVGKKAEDIFFSKYFEANGTAKILAIYNGTDEKIDLSTVSILNDLSSQSLDLAEFGHKEVGYIYPNEEIILFNKGVEAVTECSEQQDSYPDWYNVEHGVLNFGGRATLILKRGDAVIDIIGSIQTKGTNYPNDLVGTTIYNIAKSPTGENEKPSWGDDPGWVCESGDNIMTDVEETDYPLSTNRCLLVRKNTVVSGVNAVTNNIDKVFATLCDEWVGLQIPQNAPSTDKGVTESCEGMAFVGDFDYSSYYTQYVPIGGETTFEENQRNLDGTLTVPITDLYKQACRNIKVTLKDKHNEVIMTREYKVPIIITTDQATAYTEENKDENAFYALQYNLATIEVDENGDEIARHPLTIEQVREICKTCDVVIRDSATLTKALDNDTTDHPQVNNVFIYEGASLVIPNGTNETITSLSLRRKGDIVASAKVEEGGNLHLPASATAPIYLDMRIDANNWHWFTLPYNCNIADVTWVDGTPAQYNKDWFIMYYDGNSRANEQSIYENHWRVYNGTTIEAGKGYIVGIQGDITHPDYTFELRFPMTTDVLTNEHTDKTVAVNAWGVKMDITPNKKGWNLVGNPYLDYYKTSENISFKGLSLIKYEGIDPVTGDRLYDDSGTSPFLVTPVDGGWYEYQQELASDVEMMPFTAYFVQVGDPANASHTDGMELHAKFVSDNRGRMSLIRRAPQEVDGEQEPVIVRVEVANAKGESDKTTLIIDDRFTNEYEMNADFFKWFGDYYRRYTKPVLYSMGADQGKRAFNALSEQLAAQPVALGMFAAQAGDYTFTLTRKRCDLSRVEEVWLYDATTATYTNLMQQDYTFTTAKTEGEGRFYLSVKMRQNAPTDITDIYGGNVWANSKDGQIIVSGLTDNTQLWIYDATGKLLHTEQTTNFQHVYEAPVAGTYFVRTQVAGQSQTIKVLVE